MQPYAGAKLPPNFLTAGSDTAVPGKKAAVVPCPSDTHAGRDNNTSSGCGGLVVISRAPDAEVEEGEEDEAGLEVVYLDTDPADLSGWGRVGGGGGGCGDSGELAAPSILYRSTATAGVELTSHNHRWWAYLLFLFGKGGGIKE